MIRINLLPTAEAQKAAGQRQEMAFGVLIVGAAVVLLVLAHSFQQARIFSANRELAQVNRDIAAIQGPFAEATRMEQQKAELKEKLAVIAELERKTTGPVHVLSDLSAATPERLWLTEFAENGNGVKISGFGVDEQTVADFLRKLSASPYFRNIDLEETSEDEKTPGRQKKFVLKGQVNYLGAQAPAKVADATPGDAPGKVVPGKVSSARASR